MPRKREVFQKTKHPGIYARLYDGVPAGYSVKAQRRGVKITGNFDRVSDARSFLETEAANVRRRRLGQESVAGAIARYRNLELPRLAASERRNRIAHLAFWEAALGRVLLRDLKRSVIAEILTALRSEGISGRPVKFATVNRYRAALSAVLSAAVDWEWLEANPAHQGSRRKKVKGEREEVRERELTEEEWERLVPALQASRDRRLLPLVICALGSGGRLGELMGMERSRLELHPRGFDPTQGEMVLGGAPRYTLSDSKTGAGRVLYFPGEAGEVLRGMAATPVLSRYVWAIAPGDGAPVFPRMAFRRAMQRANIADFHFHDLRHMWASRLVDAGCEIGALMVLGGWRTVAMVRRYSSRAQRRGSEVVRHAASLLRFPAGELLPRKGVPE